MMKNVLIAAIVLAAPVAYAGEAIITNAAVVPTVHPIVAKGSVTEFDGNDFAVDELLKIAFNEEESLRIAAVEVMGEIGNPRARACLGIVLYGNSMGTVRAAAADQLGNMGDGESVYALALALDSEKDDEVRDVIEANIEKNLSKESQLPVASAEPNDTTPGALDAPVTVARAATVR